MVRVVLGSSVGRFGGPGQACWPCIYTQAGRQVVIPDIEGKIRNKEKV
jgi:hypothetical protein